LTLSIDKPHAREKAVAVAAAIQLSYCDPRAGMVWTGA
jgi:hypothetical protein